MRKFTLDKCFKFKAKVVSIVEGYIWAYDEDEAITSIENKAWTELEDEKIVLVDEVLEVYKDEELED